MNPYHVGPGSPEGGQFDSAGGAGGVEGGDPREVVPKLTSIEKLDPGERAWNRSVQGKHEDTNFSKQETGKAAENVILAYLQQGEGQEDAAHSNLDRNNYPVDLTYDATVVEVKGGRSDNTSGAWHWRLTFSVSDKQAEKENTMTSQEKTALNLQKHDDIIERKSAAMDALSEKVGHPVTARTMTAVMNHDTRSADIYSFDGFHKEISWRNAYDGQAGTYVATVKY